MDDQAPLEEVSRDRIGLELIVWSIEQRTDILSTYALPNTDHTDRAA